MHQTKSIFAEKSSTRRVLLLAFLVCSSAVAARTQEPLTLQQAISAALKHSPQAAIANADKNEAKATASMARSQLLPQLNFTEDISRGNDPVYAFGTRLRQRSFTQADFALNALNYPSPIGNFATRFSGSWMAFDSFKTQKQIHSADLMRASASSSAQSVNQQIVLRVVAAYQAVLYAQREIDVARHEQDTAAALMASVDEHVKAGLTVESDRMSAEVNVAARKQELIIAEGDLELAWAELAEAMGSADLKQTELKPIEPHEFPEQPVEQEIATALRTRPDLKAVGEARSAEASNLSAVKSEFGPRVSAYGNWELDQSSFAGSGGNNWVAGVQLTIDILPLGKRSQLARESAVKQKVDAQLAQSQLHVRMEVSQAHIHVKTAQLQRQTSEAAMQQSAESLRILKNRYGAGLATITDLLRAEDAERQSQSNYWHAVYGNALAYTDLLYAIGTLTPEATEELQ
jgi:outer membrane protein